jgi:L-alanine-DL-glutamate epimerase-like enolase superfamily enzyme
MPHRRVMSRRRFVGFSLFSMLSPTISLPAPAGQKETFCPPTGRPTHIRIERISFDYEDFRYRTPIKFGGMVVDRVTLLNVHCVVRAASGRTARGFGSMPLGNVWAFPSRLMSYQTTLGAMKALAGRIAKLTAACQEPGHPIDINRVLEPEYLKAAAEVTKELNLPEPIPKLATLVTASPFDAALHDAFGKAHSLSCYHTYGPDFMAHDLAHYLTPEFKGEYLDRYVLKDPKPRLPLYHLVGAVDPIVEADIKQRVGDGLPETLPEWINYNGLTHLKIKLNGDDLAWDVERVLRVERAAAETQARRGVERWFYSLDFNERCPNVGYLLDFLHQLKGKAPAAFERIQYIEQPTARDLKAHRANTMHEAAKLKPIVIDESLTDLESLLLAREMGYTGAALKACKGQSQALLMAAAAQKFGMFLCVQDLTCPGASLIHSASLAAHIPTVAAIEANSRQYVPAANKPWESRFPGVFSVTDGQMRTGELTGPGLGAV